MSRHFSAEEFKLLLGRNKTLAQASHRSRTVTSHQTKYRLVLERRVFLKIALSRHLSSLSRNSYHGFLCKNSLHSGLSIWLRTSTNTLVPTEETEGRELEFGECLGVKEGGCEIAPTEFSKLLNYSSNPIHFSSEYICKLVKTKSNFFVSLCSFYLVC